MTRFLAIIGIITGAFFGGGSFAAFFQGVVVASSPTFPTGLIGFIDAGSCPTGFTEVAGISTKVVRGTVLSNGDVGATGGNDSYTPSGTVAAPTFTGNAATLTGTNSALTFTGSSGTVSAQTISWPAGVPTFAGNAFSGVINHTHTVTVNDPGHIHTQSVNSGTTGGLSGYTPDTSTSTSTSSGYSTVTATTGITASTVNPAGGVSSITPAGTVAWPAGVPTNANNSFTPVGTINTPTLTMNSFTPGGTNNAPAFTGSGATVIPAYIKLIACKAD